MSRLVEALADDYRIFGPVRQGTAWRFLPLNGSAEPDLAYMTSILPPKMGLRPPVEPLQQWQANGTLDPVERGAETDPRPIALLGVHPCDLTAILALDEVFARSTHDVAYGRLRNQALIVARTCNAPRASCFCNLMGTGPWTSEGYDLRLTPTDAGHLVSARTGRGKRLLPRLELDPVTPTHLKEAEVGFHRALADLEEQNHGSPAARLSHDQAARLMDDPRWQELAERCTGCGVCTTVCPTCFCYDILDEASLTGNQVQRSRRWDSCLYLRFARMVADHPQERLVSRLQQRLFHKWLFQKEQFGHPGCVGCGRCIENCTSGIDPRELLSVREVAK